MRRSGARTASALLASVAVAIGVVAAPAVAESSPVPAKSSPNHAGYVDVRTDRAIHHLFGQWVVPEVTCGSKDSSAQFLVRLSGNGRRVPFAVGTTAECSGGSASYYAWISMFGRSRVHDPVSPGDVIRGSIFCGYQEADVSIEDLTEGWGTGVGEADLGFPARHRAFFIATAPANSDGTSRLANFGRMRFTKARVGGQSLDTLTPKRLVMRTADGVTRAAPGDLTPGGGFRVVWRHS